MEQLLWIQLESIEAISEQNRLLKDQNELLKRENDKLRAVFEEPSLPYKTRYKRK